jgi:DNA-binding XRE family transcriptional regulator
MQTPSAEFLKSMGELIRAKRTARMDQQELALCVGVSRATISAMERCAGVNSNSLFKVLIILICCMTYNTLLMLNWIIWITV